MKKTLLKEIKEMNKIAGTQMTKEQEISFIKNRLNELEFDSQKELDAYKKAHKVRKGTQLKVRSTGDKIGRALTKGAEAYNRGVGNVFFGNKVGRTATKGIARVINAVAKVLGQDDADKLTDKEIDNIGRELNKQKK
jgi:hypothetical protein